MAVLPIPGMDFTSLPIQIKVEGLNQTLYLGLNKGSGQVKSKDVTFTSGPQSAGIKSTYLLISFFHDLNSNGLKDQNEPSLPWAGVTIRLSKIQ